MHYKKALSEADYAEKQLAYEQNNGHRNYLSVKCCPVITIILNF